MPVFGSGDLRRLRLIAADQPSEQPVASAGTPTVSKKWRTIGIL
jgi:hypothetical protein